jgi:hypothetical protein
MSKSFIWVHRLAAEVGNQTGFLECDSEIAELLIEQGKAQDPSCGAHHLIDIDLSETKAAAHRKTSRKKTED